jgi:23S rRNA pseudouridine1911/1915/1917 synthase
LPHEAGIRLVDNQGLEAMTHFQVLHRFSDGTSLIKAQPQSGRTNQIRIHLKETGHPILGDTVYGDSCDLVKGFSHPQKLFLHAWMIRFTHPLSQETIQLSTEQPGWATQ